MGEFFFVLKCLVATAVLVTVMQIKINGRTMESHATRWIHHSETVQHLQDIAEGAVKAGKNGSREAADLFEDSADEVITRSKASFE